MTGDGNTNIVDVQCGLVGNLWQIVGGAAPIPPCISGGPENADTNCDGQIQVSDVVVLIAYSLSQPLPASIDADASLCPDACEFAQAGTTIETGDTDEELAAVEDNWVPSFEPDYNTLLPKAGVTVTTESQAADVVVTAGALRFQLAEHPEVLDWEPGQVVVSGPGDGESGDGGSGRNPFGFLRKVGTVEVAGDEIVVTTTMAALQEVFTGEMQLTFDYDTARVIEWDELDPEWAAQNLYQDISFIGPFPDLLLDDVPFPDLDANYMPLAPAQPGDPFWEEAFEYVKHPEKAVEDVASAAMQAIVVVSVAVWKAVTPDSFQGNLALTKEMSLGAQTGVFSYNFNKTFNEAGKLPIQMKLTGEAQFGGSIKYNPNTQIGFRVPNIDSNVKTKMWMNIDSYFLTSVDIDILLNAELTSAGGKAGSELEEQLNASADFAASAYNYFHKKAVGEPDTTPQGGWKKTLFISKPSMQVAFAGPIPVVFVETFQLDLECGFAVKASLKTSLSHKTSTTLKFNAFFEEGGAAGIDLPQFQRKVQSSVSVLGGGEASVTCGLIPRVNFLLYDALGINLGTRVSGVAKASYTSSCSPHPNSSTPDCYRPHFLMAPPPFSVRLSDGTHVQSHLRREVAAPWIAM